MNNRLESEVNSGYRISNYTLFNNDRGFALGESINAPDHYVTWQFTQKHDGNRDYYWGHYYTHPENSRTEAMSNYYERVDEYKHEHGLDVIESHNNNRLFVDMDGTVAQWETQRFEDLFEKGYFLNRPAYRNVVDGLNLYMEQHPETEVYILSAYLDGSEYALSEKGRWLDSELSQIDRQHRIYVPYGVDKAEFVPGGIRETDFLLDDYTKNLLTWEYEGGSGIKLMNGINGTIGTWQGIGGKTVDGSPQQSPEEIGNTLSAHIDGAANSDLSQNVSAQQAESLLIQRFVSSMDMEM